MFCLIFLRSCHRINTRSFNDSPKLFLPLVSQSTRIVFPSKRQSGTPIAGSDSVRFLLYANPKGDPPLDVQIPCSTKKLGCYDARSSTPGGARVHDLHGGDEDRPYGTTSR